MKIVKKANQKTKNKSVKDKKCRRFLGSLLKNTALVLVFLIVVLLITNFASPEKMTSSLPFNQVYTVIESEGGTYLGEATDLVYSGLGEFQYIEGGFYEGDFADSLRDGEGTYTWDNGDYFEGTWSADGMVEGTLTFSSGLSYTGTFTNGVFDSGVFDSETTFADGGTYVGGIVNSLRGGDGIFTWDNGDFFSGTWENDQMLNGTYTFVDGRTYTGTFNNNEYDTGVFSLGTLAEEKGFSNFEATFSSGVVTGFNFKTTDGLAYDGDITGNASITYKSGNTYTGAVKDGVRDGDGVFAWRNSSGVIASYQGSWADGIMSGSGKYYFSADAFPYIEGTFVDGKPDGSATYYKESGNTFTTTWSNGQCTKVVES